jgi:hypothetical protein
MAVRTPMPLEDGFCISAHRRHIVSDPLIALDSAFFYTYVYSRNREWGAGVFGR